jgi:outer membrane lipoprotein-sorting protein
MNRNIAMKRLRLVLLALPLALAVLAGVARAQQVSLSEISAYLNDLQTAQGEFTQINGDGTISTGTIYIKRPGRIRFEYNPPERSLVIAGGGSVAIFDPRSNTGPDQYPLAQTPLSIILARNVDLSRARMVTGFTSDGTTTTVTAQDPDNPEYGNIQLVFTANPVELRQWIVTDEAAGQTTVILGDLTKGGRIGDNQFNIQLAAERWNR